MMFNAWWNAFLCMIRWPDTIKWILIKIDFHTVKKIGVETTFLGAQTCDEQMKNKLYVWIVYTYTQKLVLFSGQEPGSFSMGYIKVGNKTKKRQVVLFKKFSQFEVHGFSRGRAEVLVSEWFIKKAWLGVWLVSIIARRRRLMCMSRWHRNRAYTIEMWNISLILRYALQRTEVRGMCSVCADL